MDNLLLRTHTAADIDSQIQKILRGLGHPEPPLDLFAVRELLRLDKGYYSSTDDSWLREKVSRLRVAGKQVLLRPALLVHAVRKLDLKALYLPDQRRILLDQDLPEKKHRWNEAHEITHSVIPWHSETTLGDDAQTLTSDCHAQIEAEANFGAGRLLFLGNRFAESARDLTPGLAAVRRLHRCFGNTMTTTLWRYVEQAFPDRAMVGVISSHPGRRAQGFDNEKPCRYCIGSPLFQRDFSHVTPGALWQILCSYCGAQRGGLLGEDVIILSNHRGVKHKFHFETFYNRYEALTLGLDLGLQASLVAVEARLQAGL